MILPKDKFDTASIEELKNLSPEEFDKLIPHLLEWLKDMNWPVAAPIAKLLSTKGKELTEPIRTILKSDDTIWKKWIISDLLCHTKPEIRISLKEEIFRITNNPTKEEIDEEVVEAARDVAFLLNYNDL